METKQTPAGNSRTIMIAVIVIALVIGAVVVLSNKNSTMAPTTDDDDKTAMEVQDKDEDESKEEATEEKGEEKKEEEEDEDDETAAEKVIEVNAGKFFFDPKEIKVKKGDTVTIKLNNKDGTHDWVLDEFNAKSKQINGGESDTITFVADKAGTFEYYCSVGQHRQMGMVGKLIVEE